MKTQEAVVDRIRGLCKIQHITINHLAYISGMAPSTVKNIMYGNSENTGVGTIGKLCNGLEVTVRDFFNDDRFGSLDPEID